MNSHNNYKTLVLSGNSTNAVLTLGALQYLYDNGLLNDVVNFVGTSSGAILSLLLMIGYQPLEILIYLCTEKVYKSMIQFNISNMLLMGKPIMSYEPINNCITQLIIEKIGFIPTMKSIETISSIQKKLVFTTYNLTDEKKEYITSDNYPDLSVVNAIRMSSNFPLIFEPFSYEDKLYLDGGVVDNFAIEFAENMGGKCLGIITENQHRKYNPHDFGTIEFVWKIFHVFISSTTQEKIDRTSCDVIKLDYKMNFFNFNATNLELIEMFSNGYQLCKQEFLKLF